MGYPTIKGITSGVQGGGATLSLPVTLPSGIVDGDLILVFATAINENTGSFRPIMNYSASETWNNDITSNDPMIFKCITGAFWKNSTGSDDISITSVYGAYIHWTCYVLSNSYVKDSIAISTTSDSVNPPTLTLDYTNYYKWFSSFGTNGVEGPINAPSGYSSKNGTNTNLPSGSGGYSCQYSAYKDALTSSETPGDWMIADSGNLFNTGMITLAVSSIPSKITIGNNNALIAKINGSDNPDLIIKL